MVLLWRAVLRGSGGVVVKLPLIVRQLVVNLFPRKGRAVL